MTVATWKTGVFGKADAQKVANELNNLPVGFEPADIVEMAKDPTTESHKCFEWDNDKAAEKYRLHQARKIVTELVFVEKEKETVSEPIRMFFKTSANEGYKPTTLILQNKDEYALLLERCAAELRSFKNKYKSLTEYNWLWELIA